MFEIKQELLSEARNNLIALGFETLIGYSDCHFNDVIAFWPNIQFQSL